VSRDLDFLFRAEVASFAKITFFHYVLLGVRNPFEISKLLK